MILLLIVTRLVRSDLPSMTNGRICLHDLHQALSRKTLKLKPSTLKAVPLRQATTSGLWEYPDLKKPEWRPYSQ